MGRVAADFQNIMLMGHAIGQGAVTGAGFARLGC